MEVLARLAAQGRSLGLHLIPRPHNAPSGAVSAHRCAQTWTFACLRCVSAPDSTDAYHRGRTRRHRVSPVARSCRTRARSSYTSPTSRQWSSAAAPWPRTGTEPVGAAPARALSWGEDVDAAARLSSRSRPTGGRGPAVPGGTVVSLGLEEGITSRPHRLGRRSIQIQTSAHEAHYRPHNGRCPSLTRIALAPANLCTSSAGTVDCAAYSQLPVRRSRRHRPAGSICDHRPRGTGFLTDAPQLRSYLSHISAAPQARWTPSLLATARRAGVVIVAASLVEVAPSSAALGAFSTRIVRAGTRDGAVHAGMRHEGAARSRKGRLSIVQPGKPRLACIPRQIRSPAQRPPGRRDDWHIPSPPQVAALVKPRSPILTGPYSAPPGIAHCRESSSGPWGRRPDHQGHPRPFRMETPEDI